MKCTTVLILLLPSFVVLPALAQPPTGSNPISGLPTSRVQIEVHLKSTDSTSVASTLNQLYREELVVIANQRTNSLSLRGPNPLIAEAKKLIARLDVAQDRDDMPVADATRARNKSPKNLEELRKDYEMSEQAARETAAKWRTKSGNSKAPEDQLRRRVAKSFALREALHEAELNAMQQKLNRTREAIKQRKRISDQIIDRRVQDLLNPNLKWDVSKSNSKSPRRASERKGPSARRPVDESLVMRPNPLLARLWPLLKSRSGLVSEITAYELQAVESLNPIKIPEDATPEVKQRLEAEKTRNAEIARMFEERIESRREELDRIDRQIAVLKKKLEITGVVVSIGDDRNVEISVGHDDGVRAGMKFQVSNGEESIGRVKVINTEADKSIARIIEENEKTPIRSGHRAATPFDDRVLAEIVGRDPGEPIYNDRLKRFKFRLEKMVVSNSVEIAEEFSVFYMNRGNPSITGVWGDPRSNSLVIIGPPEADQAIRETLAQWEALNTTGIDLRAMENDSLEAQQKRLQILHRSALQQLTARKLEIIDAEAVGEKPDGERLVKLNRDLENDTDALEAVERKLKVISESLERLQSSEGGSSSETNRSR